MMQQYRNIKGQNTDCILFFRLGDFYEMFDEDARLVSKELDLTLTTRDRTKENPDERIPMCGVPYHSSDAYISRLIAKGYKVAICEQTEDPALSRGLVSREVVRVITPGTVIDSAMLEEGRATYLCSIFLEGDRGAVCFADLSTGEACVTSFSRDGAAHLLNELGRFVPAEAVLNGEAAESKEIQRYFLQNPACVQVTAGDRFSYDHADRRVTGQFGTDTLARLEAEQGADAVFAVGGLLSYLEDTQKTDLSHLNSLDCYGTGQYMELDLQTRRNLELTEALRSGEKRGSLLWVLDKTKTSMGARLLRAWISRPLLSPAPIKRRLDAVSALYHDTVGRSELMLALKEIGDMERLIGKAVYGTANARDLSALSKSIAALPALQARIAPLKSGRLSDLNGFDLLSDIRALIDRAIVDEPPFSVREGGMIRPGYHQETDRLRGLLDNSAGALSDIEARERARTGKKLKVGFNKVFGYYIEIPRSMSEDVPGDYVRKQTLSNCERFITQDLKTLESQLITAKDSLEELEYRLFTELRERVAKCVARVQAAAAAVAEIDVLCGFAETAVKNNYTMPEIDYSDTIEIRDGRHPVVERTQKDTLFVPNDAYLDGEACRAAVITGPNMAGKSTYMRQTALIVLMAQIGSFVPARSARIGIVDRVFTRIGASDDLSGGRSTFMVEMTEVAEILKNATRRSLILLDEIGRGTSTYDGMSIARAVLEHCADVKAVGAKTLFATHYHELTALEGAVTGVRNLHIAAKKRKDDIIFLRKIVPGGTDDSYGIEVANLAGVPPSVIRRARAVLSDIEAGGRRPSPAARPEAPGAAQLSLSELRGGELTETLRKTDINTLTPLEAMSLLFEMKKNLE